MRQFCKIFLIVMFLSGIEFSFCQIPQTLSFQGLLSDKAGQRPADDNYTLTFKLYDKQSGGSALWTEEQSDSVVNGLISVKLGEVNPLNLPFDKPYWLGISVNGGDEFSPRTPLTSSAYSLAARTVADSAITTSKVANGQLVRSINSIKDNIVLEAGDNVSIDKNGNVLRISATGGSGSLSLPFKGTTATSETAFDIKNNGGGSAIKAHSDSAIAIIASGSEHTALWAYSNKGSGVHGQTEQGKGVVGESSNGIGVYGKSENGKAAQFDGEVQITKTLQVDDSLYANKGVKFPDGTFQKTAATDTIGNSLNDAYNAGGPGSGRMITANSGAFEINGTDGVVFKGILNQGTIPAEGSGARMMWYPGKAAFRVGYAYYNYWNDANIGKYSFATGYGTMASGNYSTAMGSSTEATGGHSTAMGYDTEATGDYSTAMGRSSEAIGDYSTAMGYDTEATGISSTAMGYDTEATGDYSTAMGYFTQANAIKSIVLGSGRTYSSPLKNEKENSLVVSFHTDSATFFVGPAAENHGIGKVGIGTTNPAKELDVNGDAHVRGKLTSGSANVSLPIAYAHIDESAAKLSGTDNISCQWNAMDKKYEITISEVSYSQNNCITVVTTTGSHPTFATSAGSGGKLVISIHNLAGERIQDEFQFVTYKP